MHLNSWIASGAVQVTSQSFQVADLHLTTSIYMEPLLLVFLQNMFLEMRVVCVTAIHPSVHLFICDKHPKKLFSLASTDSHSATIRASIWFLKDLYFHSPQW